ncbi:class I SAM-dependent methyltransferase [Halovivax gelatinilyticus]|uniref:class I SAM-dependent methyltransferase n=1 Tax=Halovivax gelatinilyticus TaxID=2961597 RepID=UPI0020CA2864|nr:class I SAM-dependent methyltransferase [Halovivax gelatinilyticus]
MNSTDVRREWATRSGEYSPAYYAYYGPDERSETVSRLCTEHLAPADSILELGCSAGRHLAHLQREGFRSLAGIEINDEAFSVMADAYPDLADDGTFYAEAIEDVVGEFDDDQFDAVYSVETLQHLHPDLEWVFDELARITSTLLVTVENEGDEERTDDVAFVDDEVPLYYRNWNRVFTGRGLTEIAVEPCGRDTARAFTP